MAAIGLVAARRWQLSTRAVLAENSGRSMANHYTVDPNGRPALWFRVHWLFETKSSTSQPSAAPQGNAVERRRLSSASVSEPSAPGCWKGFVARLDTLVSHQPGLGLRQLSTGHGAICWDHKESIDMAPACTACHYLGWTSALVEGTVADHVVHVASAPPSSRRALHGALLQ
ncbi:hypothetical protein SVAN01_10061 [Stagonosporopsis vannaccii]|nr:hypothetical protein SVAN01_10061 [Stagonosporopsis vannaccii]